MALERTQEVPLLAAQVVLAREVIYAGRVIVNVVRVESRVLERVKGPATAKSRLEAAPRMVSLEVVTVARARVVGVKDT